MRTSSKHQVIDLAEQLSKALISDIRNDGTKFVKLKDNSPDWMTDVIHNLHGDMLPNDTMYKVIKDCADALSEASQDSELTDVICEIEADIYHSDLYDWLSEHSNNVGYVDEAMEEYHFTSITDAIQAGQIKQIEEVGFALISELEDLDLD